MSHQVNTDLLEQTQELIDLAHEHAEFWTGTQWEKTIDFQLAQVIKDIDNNNLEHLYAYTKPTLERTVAESAETIDRSEWGIQ